jgi:hypothetical protein
VNTNRIRPYTLARGARLPTMFFSREQVEAGGLMSYGSNFPDLFRRAAECGNSMLFLCGMVLTLTRGHYMRRCEFITLLGTGAAAW